MKEDAPTILYVGCGRRPTDEAWGERCAQAGMRVESVGDVYLALARLGRGRIEPDAVLVCVDYLDHDEYEFFGLVSRYYCETTVYACGGPASADRLESAMDAGARGIVDPERFDEFAAEVDRRPVPRTSSVPPGRIAPEDFASVPLPPPPPDPEPIAEEEPDRAAPPVQQADPPVEPEMLRPVELPVDEEVIEEPFEQETPSSSVPMPWRSRDRGPMRTPPGRVSPDSNGSRPDRAKPASARKPTEELPSEPDARDVDGPLLTPEELHLLIDDDVRLQPMLPDEADDEEDSR